MKKPHAPSFESIKDHTPNSTTGKALAIGAGVAAAAAVGYAATRALRKGSEETYRVRASEEGWMLEGGTETRAFFDTKSAAVDAGREIARAHLPSHLVIENGDGEVVREHSYAPAG